MSVTLAHTVSSPVARAVLYAFTALVLAFLVLPILAIVPLSFNSSSFLSYPIAGFSLRWYEELIGSSGWSSALRNSVIIATATTALATPLGTLAALGLTRLGSTLKPLLIALLLAPMFVPVIIVAVASYFLYAQLGLAHSVVGLVLGHTVLATPFVVVVVHASLQGFDATLLRAGASLGARPLTVVGRVLLPLIAPGMFAAAIFAFTTSFDEIVVAMLLAGVEQKTLPLKMFEGVRDHISPAICAAATLLVLTSIVLLAVVEALRRQRARLFGSPT
jgi:putative spermidine/putrescine transport system permease protein